MSDPNSRILRGVADRDGNEVVLFIERKTGRVCLGLGGWDFACVDFLELVRALADPDNREAVLWAKTVAEVGSDAVETVEALGRALP